MSIVTWPFVHKTFKVIIPVTFRRYLNQIKLIKTKKSPIESK